MVATVAAMTPDQRGAATDLRALHWAESRVGDPYVFGGSGPRVFDCSGLTSWSYHMAGRPDIPRTVIQQWNGPGVRVSRAQLRPGDLLFFYSGPSHVTMYVGNGQMVAADHPGTNVRIEPVYWGLFTGAKQIGP